MKIYMVSIAESNRLDATLHALREYDIEPEVCLGVNGSLLSQELMSELVLRHPLRDALLRKMTPGEIGCSLSHFLTMHEFLKSGTSRAWIMEDDIRFARDPRPVMRAAERWAERHSGYVVNWGGQKDPQLRLTSSAVVHRNVEPKFAIRHTKTMPFGTFCMLMDRSYCMDRLAKALPLPHSLDTYGLLNLRSSFYVLEEDELNCDPDSWEKPGSSLVANRPTSTRARLFPRGTAPRFLLERARDALLRQLVASRSWELDRTRRALENLRQPIARASARETRSEAGEHRAQSLQ